VGKCRGGACSLKKKIAIRQGKGKEADKRRKGGGKRGGAPLKNFGRGPETLVASRAMLLPLGKQTTEGGRLFRA